MKLDKSHTYTDPHIEYCTDVHVGMLVKFELVQFKNGSSRPRWNLQHDLLASIRDNHYQDELSSLGEKIGKIVEIDWQYHLLVVKHEPGGYIWNWPIIDNPDYSPLQWKRPGYLRFIPVSRFHIIQY